MYPEFPGDSYGVFVKNFETALDRSALQVVFKSTIRGKGKNFAQKLIKYASFYLSIIYQGLFKSYDLIYCHNVSHSVVPVLILQIARNKKLILNAHGEDILPMTSFGQFLGHFVQYIISRSTLLVVPSHYFKEVVSKKFGLPQERVFVSPSGGVDLEIFQPKSSQVQSGTFTIGFVSRIEINKGYLIFLEAIQQLRDRFANISFKVIIAGGGGHQAQLQKFILDNHLQDKIQYLGPQPQKDLKLIFHQIDVFVFPTVFKESLGLIGLEAMACGIPVIGSRSGGLTDYIVPGHNGFLFEPGHVEDLLEKLVQYYQLPEQQKCSMRQGALETARNFAKDKVASDLIQRIQQI